MAAPDFDFIVSLGHRCRLARQLRDYYGFGTAFPFDWWLTPLDGLDRFLRDWDLDRLYDPDRLRLRRRLGDPMQYIENADYGIGLHHEFPRAKDDTIQPDWREHVPAARTRTGHLMQKFDRLNRPGWRLLFVREIPPKDERKTAAVTRLRAAALQHVPAADTTFLLVSRGGVRAQGWTSLAIDDPTRRPWAGDSAVWGAALDTLGFNLNYGERQASAAGTGA